MQIKPNIRIHATRFGFLFMFGVIETKGKYNFRVFQAEIIWLNSASVTIELQWAHENWLGPTMRDRSEYII